MMLSTCGLRAMEENSLLWRVRTPAGKVSYIFGTIHLRDSTVLFQRDTVLTLLEGSRVFIAEIDLDSMATGISPTNFILPNGQTIESLYTPKELVLIRAALQRSLGAMASMVENMRPGALVSFLSMNANEATSSHGVDEFLWTFAGKHHIARRGAEYISEQLDVLLNMPKEVLVEVAGNMDSMDTEVDNLLGAYIHENLDSLNELGEELETYPEFSKSLNADRNALMVTRLRPDFEQGGMFLAVGALHLPGTTGMLALLRKQGYTVTPVFGGNRIAWTERL